MTKIIIILSAILVLYAFGRAIQKSGHGIEVVTISTFDNMLNGIELVESGGDPWAIGDGGEAVGSYQIHKIYVDDVNRILDKRMIVHRDFPFTYKDRYDPKKSREMATIFLKHYGGSTEEMARKHNGGPQGHKKKATEKYWAKVKARMESAK
jgi:hypothetical protein